MGPSVGIPELCLEEDGEKKTMHVDAVQRNPQNAAAPQLRLSVWVYTIFGSFCRDCLPVDAPASSKRVLPILLQPFILHLTPLLCLFLPSANASVADL